MLFRSFPFGQQLYDLPQGVDNLNLLVLRLLALFTEPATAMNVFYLLGFAAAAATSHYVLRRLGARRIVAAATSLLYAFVPYHLLRRTGHLLLSSYAMVPIGLLFILAVMGETPPLVADRRRWWPGIRLDRQAWWVVAGCVALGSTGSYYGVFFGYLAVTAGFVTSLARRHARHVWSAMICASITLVTMLANTLPTILYWRSHGTNSAVFSRRAQETEEYGLRIQQLFLPRIDHRLATLGRLGYRAFGGPIYSEQGSYLGVVLAAGFILAVVAAFVNAAGGSPLRGRVGTIANAGVVALIAMITATISGLSYLLALGGLTMIRGWNRISIELAFIAAIALALGLTIIVERVRFRWGARRERTALAIAIAAVLGIGWFDQTSPADGIRQTSARRVWDNDRAFFTSMRAALPAGAAVYQFPESPFPEGGSIGQTGLYDGARGYLFAPDLKWSFGAVLGRFPARPVDLADWDGPRIAEFLTGQGFQAVVVDRFGYADHGVSLIDRLGVLRPPEGQSGDGRYVWFTINAPGGVSAPGGG